VETAFITIPGHLFMAFSLDMPPDESRKSFLKAEDLIMTDYKTWIPVEVTELDGGFLKAWQTGAKQWREASAREQAGFFPIRDAWMLYEPVGLPGEGYTVRVPQEDKIMSAYLQELVTFIDREIYPKIAEIQAEINRTGGSPESYNKLGILYARYGLYDRAEREFNRVLDKQRNYVPALINLGNIYYLNGDIQNAKVYYDRAYQQQPDNPKVLLTVARVNHEMENYGTVKQTYAKLKEVDPDLAQQFAYLDLRGDDATRAAAIGRVKEVVLWEE
jgi:tetratricopeptide (TPR) repeat protein